MLITDKNRNTLINLANNNLASEKLVDAHQLSFCFFHDFHQHEYSV